MNPHIDPVEAAIRDRIRHHKLEIEKLERALAVVAPAVRPQPTSTEFADGGIIAGATKLLAKEAELTTRVIAERLLAGGIQTRAKNFHATVLSTLSNSPKFIHRLVRRDRVWSLATPTPEAECEQ